MHGIYDLVWHGVKWEIFPFFARGSSEHHALQLGRSHSALCIIVLMIEVITVKPLPRVVQALRVMPGRAS